MADEPVDVTGDLAKFVCATSFDALSTTARARVREHLLDCVGVALAASLEQPGRILADFTATYGAPGPCRVIGSALSVGPVEAAWMNGALCHLLDFDDSGFSHPTACILPAALAIGEERGLAGSDLVLAIALGYEVFERLSRSGRRFEDDLRRRGIHPTSVYGCPAAAAAGAKLLGLDDAAVAVAMGLAASASGGLTEHFGTWGKGPQAGNAARAGVVGALLAERGYRGGTNVLGGTYGLFSAELGRGQADLSRVGEAFGESWAIVEPGLTVKAYPACGETQRGIAAAIELHRELGGEVEQIEEVVVGATDAMLETLHVDWPTDGFAGKFSLRYCVAVALADGVVEIDSFRDEVLARPLTAELMKRITIVVRPSGGEGTNRSSTPVDVHLRDGRVLHAQVDAPLGNVANRMSQEELEAKFVSTAGRLLDAAAVATALETIGRVEELSVRRLLDALVLC